MRYAIQIVAILGDIFVILAVSYLIWKAPFNPVIWIIIALAFRAWHDNGGFIAWKLFDIKDFMENAKLLWSINAVK